MGVLQISFGYNLTKMKYFNFQLKRNKHISKCAKKSNLSSEFELKCNHYLNCKLHVTEISVRFSVGFKGCLMLI